MKNYNFKHHSVFSIIISLIIGVASFFIVTPNSSNSSIGMIKSMDTPSMVHTQTSYGYDFIFILVICSLLVLLVTYKPIQKILIKIDTDSNFTQK